MAAFLLIRPRVSFAGDREAPLNLPRFYLRMSKLRFSITSPRLALSYLLFPDLLEEILKGLVVLTGSIPRSF